MENRFCRLVIISLLAFALFIPLPVAAKEGDNAVVLVEETDGPLDTAESISEILTEYRDSGTDLAKLQRVKIMELRSAYENLSMAEKVHVRGLDVLESAEAVMEISYSEADELSEDPETMAGMHYAFEIRDDRLMASLSIRYMTDENKDGSIDCPELILVSPSGEEIPIRKNTNTMSGNNLTLDMVWEDTFVQLDIRSADMGLWQVKSSNVVYFSLGEYIGREQDAEFESVDTDETEGETTKKVRHTSRSAAVLKALWPLLLATVLGAGVIVAILVFSRRKKKARSLKKQDEDNYDDGEDELTEEEYRKMQQFVEKQRVFLDDGSDDEDEDDLLTEDEPNNGNEAGKDIETPGYYEVAVYPSELGDDEDDENDLNQPAQENMDPAPKNVRENPVRQFGQRTKHTS